MTLGLLVFAAPALACDSPRWRFGVPGPVEASRLYCLAAQKTASQLCAAIKALHSPQTTSHLPAQASLCHSSSTMSGAGRGKGKTAGKKAVSRSTKAGLQFPVGRIARCGSTLGRSGSPVRAGTCWSTDVQHPSLTWRPWS